jgi:hypothetical protein
MDHAVRFGKFGVGSPMIVADESDSVLPANLFVIERRWM